MSSFCSVPEFYVCEERTARKKHVCCECSAPILVGENHVYARGSWEGDFAAHRQHLLCCEACELIRDAFGGECIGFGCLKEEFGEMRHIEDRIIGPATNWKRLRCLMARILWRERQDRQPG